MGSKVARPGQIMTALPWPARDEELRELWNAGLTTAEIGARMGVTRYSVIGRARRIRLPPRPSPILPPPPNDEILRELWDAGLAVEEIANRLSVTCNSVVGGVRRMKLKRRRGKSELAESERTKRKNDAQSAKRSAERRLKRLARAAQTGSPHEGSPFGPSPLPPEAHTLPPLACLQGHETAAVESLPPPALFPDHRGKQCRFPFGHPGTPEFRFCSSRAMPGRPYCPDHMSIAYTHYEMKPWRADRAQQPKGVEND